MYKNMIAIFSLCIILLSCSGCLIRNSVTSDQEVQLQLTSIYNSTTVTMLSMSTVNGDIEITTWDEPSIFINATKRSRNGMDDLDNASIHYNNTNSHLSIDVHHIHPIEGRAIDLIIWIPENVSVHTVSTTNGGIDIQDVIGNLTVFTTNGGIDIVDVEGYISADSTNGNIHCYQATGIDRLISTNGGISAQIASLRDDIHIRTTNGGIELDILSTLNATIKADTLNGFITYDKTPLMVSSSSSKHLKALLGDGGDLIDIDTTNGSITLTFFQQ